MVSHGGRRRRVAGGVIRAAAGAGVCGVALTVLGDQSDKVGEIVVRVMRVGVGRMRVVPVAMPVFVVAQMRVVLAHVVQRLVVVRRCGWGKLRGKT